MQKSIGQDSLKESIIGIFLFLCRDLAKNEKIYKKYFGYKNKLAGKKVHTFYTLFRQNRQKIRLIWLLKMQKMQKLEKCKN